jgi:arylsulfatase
LLSFFLAFAAILSSMRTSAILSLPQIGANFSADGLDLGFSLPTLSSLLLLSDSGGASPESGQREPPPQPLNVVLFYGDDWTLNALGKLDPNIHTPNLDRLADEGMLFTSNFVTTSICMTSRATLLTGVYAAVHNQTRIGWYEMYKNLPWNETFFPLMKANSYYTGVVGKWHLSAPPREMEMAFDVKKSYYGKHWVPRGGGLRHVTDLNQADALAFLKTRPKGRNFLLKVSFFATHAVDGAYPSYQPKNSTLNEHYSNSTIPPPRTATNEHWERLPHFFTERNEGRRRWKRRFEPGYFQESIRALYSMATEVDAAVGAVIHELKSQGVYNETLIIFTTDNGNLHG